MVSWVLAFAVLVAALVAFASARGHGDGSARRELPPAVRLELPRAERSAEDRAPEPPPAPEREPEARVAEPTPPRAMVPVGRALRAPEPLSPVVFAHGFAGFDRLRVLELEYFRGVRPRVGERVHFLRVSPFAGVEVRAAELMTQLEQVDAPRIHVIAHSMGGLDARYAIAALGGHRRIASLTTVGTPHRGTPLADAGARLMRRSRKLTDALVRLGLSAEALEDLSTERMVEWNDRIRNVAGVRYASYVATPRRLRDIAPPLWAGYALLQALHGDNDGIVPAWSQPWGEVLGHLDADHWGSIGWSRRFDAPAFYQTLIGDLRASDVRARG